MNFQRQWRKKKRPFEGLVPQMHDFTTDPQRIHSESDPTFMTREPCKTCGGAAEVGNPRSYDQRSTRTRAEHSQIQRANDGAAHATSTISSYARAKKVVTTWCAKFNRVAILVEVGLGYLTLDRESGTLTARSATNRLPHRLAPDWRRALRLDERHRSASTRQRAFACTLRRLRDSGIVIVVEHDEETIRAADHIVDLGPAPDLAAAKLWPKESWKTS